MQIRWFFGPNKESFVLGDHGRVHSLAGDPFHGIVSRGTLNLLNKDDVCADVWLRHAHRVFLEDSEKNEPTTDLAFLRECITKSGALSFGESATCVQIYLQNHCQASLKANRLEAWNIKEGHTSSVWKVSCLKPNEEHEFVLNVARDDDAGAELKATFESMRKIGHQCPSINMATVQDILKIRLNRGRGPIDVVVTRNEWVGYSTEIHAVYDQAKGSKQYLLVERFLTSDEKPAQITSVYGRRCTEEECRRIENGIAQFIESASTVFSRPPELDLTQGDLVWDGHGAVVVATSDGGVKDA